MVRHWILPLGLGVAAGTLAYKYGRKHWPEIRRHPWVDAAVRTGQEAAVYARSEAVRACQSFADLVDEVRREEAARRDAAGCGCSGRSDAHETHEPPTGSGCCAEHAAGAPG